MAPRFPADPLPQVPADTGLISTPQGEDSTSGHLVDHELLQDAAGQLLEADPEHGLSVEYQGQWASVRPGERIEIGRDADIRLDANPFLHRKLLRIAAKDGLWFVSNIGTRMTLSVVDGSGRVQGRLLPGAHLPIVFERTSIHFSAGERQYEVKVHAASPVYMDLPGGPGSAPETAGRELTHIALTPAQRLLLLALCESVLLRGEHGLGDIPTSARAAERLGWTVTAFNRKLDNVCEKLDRIGVEGLRGGARSYATNRRARLVDYVVRNKLVGEDELYLLDVDPDAGFDDRTLPARR
ncbi:MULTISPECIES: hypothetical protein [unclassified Pseudoclavibacter]|uniref:hypothetical protein n=1 Tax=unclassified Pseudoclavibacter TaxID=2615177 RepID=UPI002015EF2F|nr:hypothetical protein [Pseudoclavibacter sp. Marseille-Q4354]